MWNFNDPHGGIASLQYPDAQKKCKQMWILKLMQLIITLIEHYKVQ